MFRDRHNQRYLSVNGILNRLRTVFCGNEDSCRIGLELFLGLSQVWQQRQPEMLAFLPRRHAAHYVRAIRQAVFRITSGDAASEALVNYSRVLANAQVLDCIIVAATGG